MTLFCCGAGRPGRHRRADRDHRILYRHQFPPGAVHRQILGHRPRHQCDPGPGDFDGIHGACRAGDLCRHHRHLFAGGPVRHRHRGEHHAVAGGHGGGAGCIRSGHRQCRRHRGNGGSGRRCAQDHRRAGRGGQHHQGRDQGLCHRFGGPGRAGAVRRLHPGPEVFRGAGHRLLRRPDAAHLQPVPIPGSWSACCSAACCPICSAAWR